MNPKLLSEDLRSEIKEIFRECISESLPNTPIPSEKELDDELLTQTQAADFLRISVATLIKRKKSGDIPFSQHQKGAQVFYRKSVLIKLLTQTAH